MVLFQIQDVMPHNAMKTFCSKQKLVMRHRLLLIIPKVTLYCPFNFVDLLRNRDDRFLKSHDLISMTIRENDRNCGSENQKKKKE